MLKNNPDGKYDEVNMLRDIMNNITVVTVRNTEYDGMLKNNPKEINMFKVPEMRMLQSIPKGKYDEDVNVGMYKL